MSERDSTPGLLRDVGGAAPVAVLEALPIGVLVSDARGQILEHNQAARSLFRREGDPLIGLELSTLFAERDRVALREHLAAASAGERELTAMALREDGSPIAVELKSLPIPDARETSIVHIARDVSPQRAAARARRDSEEFMRMAERLTLGGSWDWDLQRNRAKWTDGMFRVFRMDPATFNGDPSSMMSLVHPDDRRKFEEAMRSVLEEGRTRHRLEYRIMFPNGEQRHIRGEGSLVYDDRGVPVRHIGSVRDVTEAKEAERTREAMIRALQEKNEELERFTYTVSHDLKSPLITITGFLGFLERDIGRGDDERVKADLEAIHRAADTMKRLLDDLLDLSRVGRLVGARVEVDVATLVMEVVELLDVERAAAGATIRLRPNLPVVSADRGRLRDVFQNLISNAIKFSSTREYPEVVIGARGPADAPVLYVSDNGVGVEPRHHERVFDLFHKLDETREGSGVGLTIVRRVIEQHGGRVWIESHATRPGATFCFTVGAPAGAADDAS